MSASVKAWGRVVVFAALGAAASCGGGRHCDPPDRMIGGLCAVPCASVSGYCDPVDGASVGEAGVTDAGADASDAPGDVGCGDGETPCDGACVSTASSAENCGACGRVCPGAPGATATCVTGVCGFACSAGFEEVGAACDVIVPRPIAPRSTGHVTVQTPTFRWSAVPGVDGGAVDVCRDRACTMVVQTARGSGTSARATSALSAGVWFWRVRGTALGMMGARTSAVWEFTVGARSAPHESSWGSVLDVNGDGFADVAVGAPQADAGVGRVEVYLGSAIGLGATPVELRGSGGSNAAFGAAIASAGDVDGDGFGDLVVGAPGSSGSIGEARLYFGSATGTWRSIALHGSGAMESFGVSVVAAGDVDGDGYGDVLIGAGRITTFLSNPGMPPTTFPGAEPAFYLYRGGASGPAMPPTLATALATDPMRDAGVTLSPAGDLDSDGLDDFLVGWPGAGGHGQVDIYMGAASGPRRSAVPLTPEAAGAASILSPQSVGDVDGDGIADVGCIQGASATQLAIYRGGPSGPGPTAYASIGFTDAISAYAGGDFTGDGLSDLIVGQAGSGAGEGQAQLIVARSASFAAPQLLALPAVAGDRDLIGYAVQSIDVDGDGASDALVGAPGASGLAGTLFTVRGGGSGPGAPTMLSGGAGAGSGFGEQLSR